MASRVGRLAAPAVLVLALAGCSDAAKGGSAGVPPPWDLACPGAPSCPDTGDGVLYAGAAAEKITPTLVETLWQDTNGNHHWDEGESFVDANVNGRFDAVWIAGYNSGRPATAVHDDTWVRAIALRRNRTTVVVASIDCVGYFYDEVRRVRAALPAGTEVDLLLVSGTHSHETQDTIGIWGQDDAHTGLSAPYMDYIRQQAVKAIVAAVADMKPARMTVAQARLEDAGGDWHGYVHDSRDPQVVDSTMSVLRFARAEGPPQSASTIATWVVWAAHPEFSGSRNNEITPDFPGMLRRVVETDGIASEELDPLGGVCLFTNGPLGTQIGPGGASVPVLREDGSGVEHQGLDYADLYGRRLGGIALRTVRDAGAQTFSDVRVAFRTKEIYADVANYRYHTAFLVHMFDRELVHFDPRRPFSDTNVPQVLTEIALLELGPVAFATFPGELNPELYVGGYDGSRSGGRPIVDTSMPNHPDVTRAPAPPYVRDLLLARAGIRYAVGLGLTQDELGYILPAFEWMLDPDDPYFTEAAGEHYEETNSIGPKAEEQLIAPLRALIAAP